MAKILIIGAGVGGLATANLLAQAGHEVHIYDNNTQPGGRAGQFEKDGFTFDTGPSWYLMPGVFERYYELLGTTAKQQLTLIKLSPAYKVYSSTKQIIITGDLDEDAKTFEQIEAGAGQKLKDYIKKSSFTYRLAVEHFLYSNFERPSEIFNKATLKHAGRMAQLSLMPIHNYVKKFFKNQQLQQLLEYPTVFLGSSPYTAPALFSLMSALDFEEGVYYPKGTMYAFVESLVTIGKKLGVHYHYDKPVKKIVTKLGHAKAITLEDGTHIDGDIIISNADLHFTETSLLEPSAQSYPESYWKKREPSPSALLMYIGIKGDIPEFEHHTLLFTKKWKENFEKIFNERKIPTPASLYICKTSRSDATAPKGHENIFVLVPLPAGITVSAQQQEELADAYLEQIHSTTGVDLKGRTVTRTLFGPNDFSDKYNAWQSTMLGPSHRLTQSAFFRTPNRSKKIKNLFYVGGSTVPGIGVPMCLISAELTFKRISQFNAAQALQKGDT